MANDLEQAVDVRQDVRVLLFSYILIGPGLSQSRLFFESLFSVIILDQYPAVGL